MKYVIAAVLAVAAIFGVVTTSRAVVNAVTPSTNDINRTNGWAHVDLVSAATDSVTLKFVSTRNFYSCFEYWTDGDTSQVIGSNYNALVTDGLYPYFCVNNSEHTEVIPTSEYVEVRMVFGAESDERFDWTRFDVLYPRSAEITSPNENEIVSGMVNFTAYLDDKDVDPISWAVREGTCNMVASANVFGNVGGKTDVATIDTSDLSNQTFSFTGDMSGMNPGMYCFVYNPKEDSGESDIRLEREFYLSDEPTDKNQCKRDGWMSFNFPSFKNQGDCVSYVQSNDHAKGNKDK